MSIRIARERTTVQYPMQTCPFGPKTIPAERTERYASPTSCEWAETDFLPILRSLQFCPRVCRHNVGLSQTNQPGGATIQTAALPTDRNSECGFIFIFLVRGQ